MTLLSITDVRKAFGGLQALDGATIEIAEGELVGLIGPNGAGKTTLFDCISGVLSPDNGHVRLGETEIMGLGPHEVARAGMVRTYQRTREMSTMTVRNNMLLAALDHPGKRAIPAILDTAEVRNREKELRDRADELLRLFELDELSDEYAGNLSGGQRKLLELARALMLDPEVLLLDEPLAGVNPTLAKSIIRHIDEMNSRGITFLIIEHEIDTIADMSDRLVVMDQGQKLVEGPPDAVLTDERVIDAYLGGPGP